MKYINMSDSEKQSIERILNDTGAVKQFETNGEAEEVERYVTDTLKQGSEAEAESEFYTESDLAISEEHVEETKYAKSESETEEAEEVEMEIEVDPKNLGLEGIMEERFVCSDCGKDFANTSVLKKHKRRFHPLDTNLESLQFKDKKINLTKKVFREAVDWTQFITEGECEKLKCVKCGKEFPGVTNLKVHVRKVHLEVTKKKYRGHSDWKPYRSESESGQPKCKKCEKVFSDARNLKCHVRDVHILQDLKPKNITKKEFKATLFKVSVGKMTMTTLPERTCMICKRIFDKKSEMKKHLVRHTKIYKNLDLEGQIIRSEERTSASCIKCGKWDGRANNIKEHIVQVHYQLHNTIDFGNIDNFDFSEDGTALKGEGTVQRREKSIQTFRCKFCEKVFNDYNLSNLNKHVRYVHEGIRRKKKEGTWLNRTLLKRG